MITQTNSQKANKKRIATIIYLLKLNEITQQQIANDLNITRQTVNRVINGHAKSSSVENRLQENLGYKKEKND